MELETENIPMEPAWKPIDQPQFLSVDLFFIDGDGYLIAFMSRLDYTAVVHIPNWKTAALKESMLADILTGEALSISKHSSISRVLLTYANRRSSLHQSCSVAQ